jgi:hypothetical protein
MKEGEGEETKLIGIYLNDHLAGAQAGLELAERCLENNRGTPLGSALERVISEIEEDRAVLESIMDAMEVRTNPAKQAMAWMAEKAGRLKLNASLTGYSDLSRVLELEALCLGIEGKHELWSSLSEVRNFYPVLASVDLETLSARAHRQRETLETHRSEAVARAFAPMPAEQGSGRG